MYVVMILGRLIFDSIQSTKGCRDSPEESKLQSDFKYGSYSRDCLGEGESEM